MRIGVGRPHLCATHTELAIHQIFDVVGLQRARKAGPAGTRVKLIKGTEQRLARHDVDVNAGVVAVVKRIAEAALGAAALGNIKLLRSQLRFELRLSRFLEVLIIFHTCV